MIVYRQCPVCESAGIHKVITAKDFTVSGETFEIWQCGHCSLRLTQNVPEQAEIGRYYRSENYISHTESSKGLINSLYLQVRKITLRTKKKLVEEQTGVRKGYILDVGAGTGAFLHYMRDHGWNIEGLEPDTGAIERARSQHNVELRPSQEIYHLPSHTFDAITLWHVLEHVHDLNGYMQQLKRLVKPAGKVFIAVPNYTSVDAEKYGGSWAAYDVPRHLYHFSPASMQELTMRHGFLIQKTEPMWFDSFYVSMLSEKYRGSGSGFIGGFLTGLRSNSKALSNPRRASSLIYVLSPQLPV